MQLQSFNFLSLASVSGHNIPVTHHFFLFTTFAFFCTLSNRGAAKNGIVVHALPVLQAKHSRSQQSRSPEITWN
jgi:hypothetical protein